MRIGRTFGARLAALAPVVAGFAAVGALVSAACVNDRIVYRDRAQFATPPSAAASFIGYSRQDTRQTVCGACHVTQQTLWIGTKHANAFRTLDTLPSGQK